MNILVFGGTGLIGQPLCASLIKRGHHVWVLSRNPQHAPVPHGVEAVKWDGETTQGWKHLLCQAEVMVNLAGENIGSGRWTKERKRRILESRTKSGKALTEALRDCPQRPRVLLQASAVGCYGTSHDRTFDESAPYGNDYLSGICMEWEAVTAPVEMMGVRRVVLRSGLVLTGTGGALPRLLLPFYWFAGGPLGSGKQWWSWIHLKDEIDAMLFLMENEKASGPFNLTAPEPVTMSEFGKVLARVVKRPYWLPTPAFALQLLLGEMSTIVLDGQRVLPKKLLELGYKFKFNELQPALKDILADKNHKP